ncbi:MAG TPA: hypothetical protein VH951_12325 [Dehalococcoidia bacterium]
MLALTVAGFMLASHPLSPVHVPASPATFVALRQSELPKGASRPSADDTFTLFIVDSESRGIRLRAEGLLTDNSDLRVVASPADAAALDLEIADMNRFRAGFGEREVHVVDLR